MKIKKILIASLMLMAACNVTLKDRYITQYSSPGS